MQAASQRQLALCGDCDPLIKHLRNQCWSPPPSISLPAGASRRPPHTAGTSRARARAHPRASGSRACRYRMSRDRPARCAWGDTKRAGATARGLHPQPMSSTVMPSRRPARRKTASLTPRLLRRDNCAAKIPRRRAGPRGEKRGVFTYLARDATYCAATRKRGDLDPGWLEESFRGLNQPLRSHARSLV